MGHFGQSKKRLGVLETSNTNLATSKPFSIKETQQTMKPLKPLWASNTSWNSLETGWKQILSKYSKVKSQESKLKSPMFCVQSPESKHKSQETRVKPQEQRVHREMSRVVNYDFIVSCVSQSQSESAIVSQIFPESAKVSLARVSQS